MALSDQRELFCQAYTLTKNGADAARRAGYAEKHANNQAHRLLQYEDVKARIEELSTEMTTDLDVITEIEHQYTAAKAQGQGQVGLKALELLSRVRGNVDDGPKDGLTLEANVVRSMEVLGKEKVMELVKKCEF
tara:strand:+ start:19349 stop:19750 length:402 start_codon:yes stop_codon:yes gene_type:complete